MKVVFVYTLHAIANQLFCSPKPGLKVNTQPCG